ncbi:MAG: MFS transporter, partial [Lachnospiraceae bacterium]|nr:MFS transporter [Lachnospiraceae bacterium]
MGLLLMFAVGAMTQSMSIISSQGDAYAWTGGYNCVMYWIAGFGIIGSYVFGLIDTKMGTRFAILLSHICMLVSGILGMLKNPTLMFIGLILLAMFMGASSNYTVSAAVQYWRIEDFPSVFSVVNPVANFINAFGPTIVAALIASKMGVTGVFMVIGIAAVISIICCLLFKPARVKAWDDKYRTAAGKPLDDVLVGRK